MVRHRRANKAIATVAPRREATETAATGPAPLLLVLMCLLGTDPAWSAARTVPTLATYRCAGNMVVAGFPITLSDVTVTLSERPARPGTDGADRRQIFLAIANSTAFDATHAVGRDAEGFYIDAGHPANATTPTRGYFNRRRATGAFHNRHGDALYLTCR